MRIDRRPMEYEYLALRMLTAKQEKISCQYVPCPDRALWCLEMRTAGMPASGFYYYCAKHGRVTFNCLANEAESERWAE